MIRVTIELLPGGYENFGRRTIGMMHVGNTSNLAPVSDYDIMIMEAANDLAGTPPRTANWCVTGHDRNQSVWALLRAALEQFDAADWEVL